jgi:hypothetical protein
MTIVERITTALREGSKANRMADAMLRVIEDQSNGDIMAALIRVQAEWLADSGEEDMDDWAVKNIALASKSLAKHLRRTERLN